MYVVLTIMIHAMYIIPVPGQGKDMCANSHIRLTAAFCGNLPTGQQKLVPNLPKVTCTKFI